MAIKLFEELAEEANKKGWYILNCYQVGGALWRVNLQHRKANGSTEDVYTAYADGKTASEALRSAMYNRGAATPQGALGKVINAPLALKPAERLPAKHEMILEKLIERLTQKVREYATTLRDN